VVNVSAEGRRLATALRKLGAGHDFVIVDGPPSVSNALTEVALAEAELCLVPVRPSGPDLFATTTMLKLIETVQSTVNQKLAARMVITQAARTNLASQVIEALRGFNVPLLTAQMGSRAAYPESQLRGVPVQNLGAAAKPASLEVEAITAEVLSILGELK
jgi:chromosome partitioning protein